MKHKSTRDVTLKSNPYLPPGPSTGMLGAMGEKAMGRRAPVAPGPKPKPITPPTMVSGFSKGITSRESNLNNSNHTFKLPDTCDPMETYQKSFGARRMNYNKGSTK
jgi:hypothetical protein